LDVGQVGRVGFTHGRYRGLSEDASLGHLGDSRAKPTSRIASQCSLP